MKINKDNLVNYYTGACHTIARQDQDGSLYLPDTWRQATVIRDTIEDIFPQLRNTMLLWNHAAAKWELKHGEQVWQFDKLAAGIARLTTIIKEIELE